MTNVKDGAQVGRHPHNSYPEQKITTFTFMRPSSEKRTWWDHPHPKSAQTDEAIRQFQKALGLKPRYSDARKNPDVVLAATADSSQQPGAFTHP